VKLDSGPETVRPPVALGCFFGLAVIVFIFGIAAFAIVFLESGADTGEVSLDVSEAYAPGSVKFIGEDNIFLVRLGNGDFVALADLDAANRTNQSRRCRVGLVPINEPVLALSQAVLRSQMSAEAEGTTSVFYEPCLGSIYDVAGIRLNGPGMNLERHPVTLDRGGHVVVDTSTRECSERTDGATFSPSPC